MLSLNQYNLLNKIKIGQEFTSRDVSKILGLKNNSLAGVLGGLSRSKYIQPLYMDMKDNRNVHWKRIK